jgi:hypothetical protein
LSLLRDAKLRKTALTRIARIGRIIKNVLWS